MKTLQDPILVAHQERIAALQAELSEHQTNLDVAIAEETQMATAIQGCHSRRDALAKQIQEQKDKLLAVTEAETAGHSHDIPNTQVLLEATEAAIANFPAKWATQRTKVDNKGKALADTKSRLLQAQYDLAVYEYRQTMASCGGFDAADNLRKVAAAFSSHLDLSTVPDSQHQKFGRLPAN